MPGQPTAETRLKKIAAYLTPAVTLLNELNDAFGSSFVHQISQTTLSVINAIENVKRNRDECIHLIENIHHIFYAIVTLHIRSNIAGSLPPATLDHIGKFTETLHKIHIFVEAQQDGSKIKYFFRQGEMNTLLKDCYSGLNEAFEVFKIKITSFNGVDEMKRKTEEIHNELLELISTLSDCIWLRFLMQ
ncbi:hypothetical protein B0H13DRAFT_2318751 [Mycena leptocephala]|nr:hypothetical protein B0H13DRAFT_2318751 [Mycena leptocephala]